MAMPAAPTRAMVPHSRQKAAVAKAWRGGREWSGPELAKHFRAVRPGVPILLISGHAGKTLTGHGVIPADVNLLTKPFTSHTLARIVQEALCRPSGPDSKVRDNAVPKPRKNEAGKDKKEEKPKEAKDKKPFFVDFESFTVNLKDPEKFLQIKLTFQMKNAEGAEAMKDLMPIVRAAVIPVLGGQDAAEIGTPEGKTKLCEQVAEAAKKSLEGKEAAESIDAVLITHMIIQ